MSRARQNYEWESRVARDTGHDHQFVGERTGAFVVCTDFTHSDWCDGDTGVELVLRSRCGRVEEHRKIDDLRPPPGEWLDVVFDHLPTHLEYSLDVITDDGTVRTVFAHVKYGNLNALSDDLRETQILPIVPDRPR